MSSTNTTSTTATPRTGTPRGSHPWTPPNDRNSNNGDYEEEEKKMKEEQPPAGVSNVSILDKLKQYKNIGDIDPASMEHILQQLQEKEMKRL